MRCVEPVKVIEILRLTEHGYSQREIARSEKCGKSTVADVQKRCRECNLQYHKAAQMTDEEIKKLLYPNSFGQPKKDDPDWPVIHDDCSPIRGSICSIFGKNTGPKTARV